MINSTEGYGGDENMKNILEINYPQEILLGLHLDTEQFATLIKTETAIALFREGKISSGMAARWLEIPRVVFLLKAMNERRECNPAYEQ